MHAFVPHLSAVLQCFNKSPTNLHIDIKSVMSPKHLYKGCIFIDASHWPEHIQMALNVDYPGKSIFPGCICMCCRRQCCTAGDSQASASYSMYINTQSVETLN